MGMEVMEMSISKDKTLAAFQRFGGAMYTPVILFAFFGLAVALSIIAKQTILLGAIAEKGTIWYDFWFVVEQGAWTVFSQMPILFAISVPIGFAKKEPGRAAMEAFVIYMCFNYFISGWLQLFGPSFGVDYSVEAKTGTGLAMIANIKTLDMGMLGAIFIACVSAWLHNKFYDTAMPEWLGIFKGPACVVAVGFAVMIPMALVFCFIWPPIQHLIASFQDFLKVSGIVGVWCYTFAERFLLPAGLHHFIYLPFIYGPAVCDGGIQQYWLQHIQDFTDSTKTLAELFPAGGFALHGSSKVWGLPGAALAMYVTAKPEAKKKTAALLIPAVLTAAICGITEPLEFTFLFVAPLLYVIHCVLAATLSASLFAIGLAGNFGGGLIDCFVQNWIPLWSYHWHTYILQIIVGIVFFFIYFFVFRFMILKNDYKTPGRAEDPEDVKLFSKAEYKAQQEMKNLGLENNKLALQARVYLDAVGGPSNVTQVTNCATRLRITVKDPDKVASASKFTKAGAYGLVKKGTAIQVIVGMNVPNVRTYFDAFLKGGDIPGAQEPPAAPSAPTASAPVPPEDAGVAMTLKAVVSGQLIQMEEVNDEMFSKKMMGDGVAIQPITNTIVAPADGDVTMVMADSCHAVGLRFENGAEILIHVGIDTVNLQGKGFQLLTKQGTHVHAGDPLIKFDAKVIKDAGYQDTVVMAITNSADYPQLKCTPDQSVTAGETDVLTF